MAKICKTCGEYNCTKHEFFLGKTVSIKDFSGSSPPEIFVGKWNYPNVYTGILSPTEYGDMSIMSSPEMWHKNKLAIGEIMDYRSRLIYGRTESNVKKTQTKFLNVMKEVAMTHKSVATNFSLKKPVASQRHPDIRVPLISKAAPVESVRLEENAPVKKKIDYLVNDSEVKSSVAIQELHSAGISSSNIIKILSAGLLGMRKNRKLVPTRWAITATDDTISKEKLNRIRDFPEISEVQVFHSEYVGNHYEFLLLPDKYSFEVIELSLKNSGVWQDYETFFPRKKYADSVTGAYYANRLALVEYLEKIRRQAQCLVIREIRPEYYAPCGVGILREISRDAFSKPSEKFNNLSEAFSAIGKRLRQPAENFTSRSWLLKNYGKQKKLSEFF